MSPLAKSSADIQGPTILRPNIYSIVEMVVFWCGLPLAIEAFLLGRIIWDRLEHVASNPNVISAFWLFLLPLGVATYVTASWAFSVIALSEDRVTLKRMRNSEYVLASHVSAIKHMETRGGLRHTLLVTTRGSLWINTSAYSFTQIESVIDYVKKRSKHSL
ncbi:hypothetical protein GCM10007874_05120 [Labrys miyagiensis]|uniref:PH domain-containing protein n=1 Tax=Labrys miyagiensis TaxID=346912 RepID=A0ABQ6CCU5_9HYPH|nr:hypothetical protein GCM10007874_05120 [Labrys miyagiensis]